MDLPSLDEVEVSLARIDFWEFLRYVDPELVVGRWQHEAAAHLQQFWEDLTTGLRPKLLIFAPPQHGKTRLVIEFVAWALGRNPELLSLYASYSQDLGVKANGELQRRLDSDRYLAVFPGTRLENEEFQGRRNRPKRNSSLLELIGHRGHFENVTVGGQINGKSLGLGIGDDLLKGAEASASKETRNKTWNWFTNDFMTRFTDDAGQIQIGTRWHLDDPLGRMQNAFPDVKILKYPALSGPNGDEPLFPEWKSREFLLERKSIMSAGAWSALYQQNPIPEGGSIIKADWLGRRYQERGAGPISIAISMDCASKPKERNDPTAAGVFAMFPDRTELWHVWVDRVEFPDLVRKTKDLYASGEWPFRPNAILIEDKDAGQQLIQQLRADTDLPVVAMNPGSLDKATRMDGETPYLSAGNLWLPESAPWVDAYVEEMITFPSGPHDDQVDLTSQFLRWRRERGAAYEVVAHPGSITRPRPSPV